MDLVPGVSILFMKVGTHAQEDLETIISRKRKEIQDTGFSMWGYGGNTCHPRTMVQPFARAASGPILLYMEPMRSSHLAEQLRAEDYSADGVRWEPIPTTINVLGSRYALCIDSLDEIDESLDLAGTRVALGNSKGRDGARYVRGRVDKACLQVVELETTEPKRVQIGLAARLVEPYAVLLRS